MLKIQKNKEHADINVAGTYFTFVNNSEVTSLKANNLKSGTVSI